MSLLATSGTRMVLLPVALIGTLSSCAVSADEPASAEIEAGSRFEIRQTADEIRISDGQLVVLSYQRTAKDQDGMFPRAHYVHPLHDLDGGVLTEDFPQDHLHHRGIFWAWHQVLVGEKAIGDAWVCRDFEWDVHHVTAEVENGAAVLQATADWKSPDFVIEGERRAIVRDEMLITVYPLDAEMRVIDFDLKLTALVDGVRIGGSDDQKGYGGFSPRLINAESLTFRGRNGTVEPQTTALEAGPWLDFGDKDRGVTLLVHPQNPPPNDQWIIRRGGSMQNAVFPGRHPVPLKLSSPVRLRYRMLIHGGAISDETIERQLASFVDAD